MEINLKLHVDDINVVLNVLGGQPTGSGVFPLWQDIKKQAEAQIAAPKTTNSLLTVSGSGKEEKA